MNKRIELSCSFSIESQTEESALVESVDREAKIYSFANSYHFYVYRDSYSIFINHISGNLKEYTFKYRLYSLVSKGRQRRIESAFEIFCALNGFDNIS